MQLSSRDQMLLQRYRDRELCGDDAVAFRRRLESEPALRAALAELEQLGRGFAAGRAPAFAAPAGFTAGVLEAVRQLPVLAELRRAEIAGASLVLCRRLLLAAVALFGLGLCWHLGLFDRPGPSRLEAAPGEIEREMDRLDGIVRSWAEPAERPR